MAEALVGVLLERLASITVNKVEQELNLVIGVDKEIENLTRTLKAIQAVLEDAEQRQVQDASVRLWLSNLKEVSDAIDEVLDEWSYEILKRQIVEKQQGEQGGENAPVAKKKVCFSIPSPCCCSSGVKPVVRRHDIAKKIKDLSEWLASIDAERKTYQFQYIETRSEKLIKHQKTSSLLDVSFGREYEKESLVSKLLDDGGEEESVPLIIPNEGSEKEGVPDSEEESVPDSEEESVPYSIPNVPSIIPIVGMGGIGKTTLSQLVYNDRKVRAHFDKRIWICVSDPFEEIQILAAIAQGLDIPYHPKANALETYSQFIYDSIKDIEKKKRKIKKKEKTKFLIVLDDVWNPTAYQWEQVIRPLRVGAKGSKILVTTRIEKVAVMMGVANNVIHLEMLSEEYCRLLFFHFACMGSRERKETRMLEVGKELVKKCKGLPLAAKTLGSLMRGKKTLEEWEGVLNSRIWKLKEFEENVFQPLLLSYYDLAPTIRRCLLYCAIFPKDYQMDRVDLIHLWMSQDYLNVKEKTEDIYMIGEAYFEDLVMRSFFQDFKRDVEGNISCFKMHDIVHDFVQYLTNNEISILDVRYPNRRLELPNAKVHHVNLTFDNESLLFPPANLRTVILDGYWGYGAESLFQLKSLRTLKMSKFWGIIPNELGGLIHLRYLNLSNNHSEELPESMCELYNLQTLIVAESSALQRLPYGVGKLINLRHLDVRGCIRLRLTGIGKLAGLRTVLS